MTESTKLRQSSRSKMFFEGKVLRMFEVSQNRGLLELYQIRNSELFQHRLRIELILKLQIKQKHISDLWINRFSDKFNQNHRHNRKHELMI